MKRCKICGCAEFSAHQRIYTDIIVDGDNHFIKNNSTDNSVAIYESEDPYGPYTCKICGMEYETLDELYEDTNEYVGYINYYDSNECIGYRTDEDLIHKYEQSIYYRGPMAQSVEGIDEKNLALIYQVEQIIAGEYGCDEIPFNVWLQLRMKRQK